MSARGGFTVFTFLASPILSHDVAYVTRSPIFLPSSTNCMLSPQKFGNHVDLAQVTHFSTAKLHHEAVRHETVPSRPEKH